MKSVQPSTVNTHRSCRYTSLTVAVFISLGAFATGCSQDRTDSSSSEIALSEGVISSAASAPEAPADVMAVATPTNVQTSLISHYNVHHLRGPVPGSWVGGIGLYTYDDTMRELALRAASGDGVKEVRWSVPVASGDIFAQRLTTVVGTDEASRESGSSTTYLNLATQEIVASADLIAQDRREGLLALINDTLGTHADDKGIPRCEAPTLDDVVIEASGSIVTVEKGCAVSGADSLRTVNSVRLSAEKGAAYLSEKGQEILGAIAPHREFVGFEAPVLAAPPVPALTTTGGSTGMGGAPTEDVDCAVKKCIALTYDDGPNPTLTPKLLELLAEAHVHATFFAVGESVAAYPEIVQQEVKAGHVVGMHTWDHPQLTIVDDKTIRSQIATSRQAVIDASGVAPLLFRPPYGSYDNRVSTAVKEVDARLILWDVDTEDWKNRDVEITTRRAVESAHPGAIILMHDVHPSSVEATPGIIRDLKEKGYTLVTVPTLLGNTNAGDTYRSR